MKNLVVLLVLAVTANAVWAEEPVYFADPNLKAAVEAQLGIIDPNATDMLGLSGLAAHWMGIVDLNGLQYATNLRSIDLHYNQISDISAVSGLINLQTLRLGMNQISDISAVSNLKNLLEMDLRFNQIGDISAVSGLINLKYLNFVHNQINDISAISNLKNLIGLQLGQNQITDINAVWDLINLKRLHLDFNQITYINAISNLKNLIWLLLEHNQVSDISAVSGLINLPILNVGSNQISDISALSGLTNLSYLGLYSNNISDISALSGLTNMETLYLFSNNISDISALSGMTSIKELWLHYNNISDISTLSNMTNLNQLYLTYNLLNCSSYDTYIPLIETNNPGIYLTYDPRPEYCDYQPDIDVSPLVYDFGDVNLGTSRSVLITISNMGNGDLTLESLDFTPDSNSDFAITSAPTLPFVIIPEGSNDVEITFTPSANDLSFATLQITSDDPDESVVEVILSGLGVKVPPAEQLEYIFEFIDTSIADGTLEGSGSGNSANNRLNALINMFKATSTLIAGEYFEDACEQLVDILKKCDGQVPPPDFVTGEAAEELANKILQLMEDLECE